MLPFYHASANGCMHHVNTGILSICLYICDTLVLCQNVVYIIKLFSPHGQPIILFFF